MRSEPHLFDYKKKYANVIRTKKKVLCNESFRFWLSAKNYFYFFLHFFYEYGKSDTSLSKHKIFIYLTFKSHSVLIEGNFSSSNEACSSIDKHWKSMIYEWKIICLVSNRIVKIILCMILNLHCISDNSAYDYTKNTSIIYAYYMLTVMHLLCNKLLHYLL